MTPLPTMQRYVALARRPTGKPQAADFAPGQRRMPVLRDGEYRVRNDYFSMDAGFLHWMAEGSSDDYLPEMRLGDPVASLTLGQVVESKNATHPVGERVMGRLAWEDFSVATPEHFVTRLPDSLEFPEAAYLGVLGGTGMTAYFGVTDIARPKPGDVALVSAAAGAVGIVAGQLLKCNGARVIGLCGSDDKCRVLETQFGFDRALNYRSAQPLAQLLADVAPDGFDIYFDNVGGETLNTVLRQMRTFGRVVLCGSVSAYSADKPPPGPDNVFEFVTRRLLMQGFMYTDQVARYGEAMNALSGWLRAGELKNAEYVLEGIDNAGVAFADMFAGRNVGKTLLRLQG
ncbi:MAG: NADP-dependent oxidoreductase [Pseudomonadales bacterium]|nr:NADP-dependent oxidoreductase [Pseudomonadales bacterium]